MSAHPQLDAALADHRVLSHTEAMTVAVALDILEKHSKGIRHTGNHPDKEQAADVIDRIINPVGHLLEMMLQSGMVAPAGYVPGAE